MRLYICFELAKMKKVLIITYYWPPSAGSGVQRWVKFAKYLPKFGWEPVIFTPENPDFGVKDDTLLNDISPDMEIIKFPIWEPYQLLRRLLGKDKDFEPAATLEKPKKGFADHLSIWARGNLLIPDPRVFWVRPSTHFLTDTIKTNQIDAVITTGPPHSLHMIGMKLKEKTGVKWLADFRDPWSKWELLDTLHMNRWVRKRHAALEARVLRSADKIVTISPQFEQDFRSLGARKTTVITNGYDPDDFRDAENIAPAGKFLISHIGTIDDLRDPRPFLTALRALLPDHQQLQQDIEVLFVGKVSPKLIEEVENDPELNQVVTIRPYVPHSEVFKLYKRSSVLLLVLANAANAAGNVPGKLFEYLAAERPVLAIGNTNGDSSKIIMDAHAGKTCAPEDITSLKAAILTLYEDYKNGISLEKKDVQKYSRENLTKKLAELLDDMQEPI